MYTYNYSYGYSLGYSGGYNPYINYTWQMLPNAKVKNSGTSGVDLQLYSGNPLDFQGSQAVVVDDVNSTNFDIRNDFTVLLACKPSGTSNSLFGNNTLNTRFLLVTRYNDSIGTRFAYNDTVYKFKDIETEAEHLSYKCLGITKSGTTLTFYWNGEVTATYTNISLPSANLFNNLILGSRAVGNGAYDGAYDNFYLFDSVLDADTIKKHTEYPNDFYQDMVNDNRTLFCTDFGGNSGNIKDDRNGIEYTITNYSPTMRTNFQTETSGMQELMIERDSLGFFLGLREFPYSDGTKPYYGIVPNDPRTTDITLQVKPDSLGGNILSGGVTLGTTGLTVGVDNDITLSSQTVNADIKMFDGFAGEIKIYKEDLA